MLKLLLNNELGVLDMVEAIDELKEQGDLEVIDEAASDDSTVPPVQYDITSYGADYDVEGLVKRLNRGDILIPPFQRNYVWNQQEASRFIESLLLGLPVPAIFLAREPDTNKLLVIDGQQRLKTLQFFYNCIFNPKDDDKKQQVFKLIKVQSKFEGLTYKSLEEQDRVKLNDSLMHAIIVKQESPQDNNTSVYHIFDRLNSEGRRLTPQEIRTAIDHGNFIDLIKELNEYENWRSIYGKKSSRLKDQELILRFLAFYFSSDEYEKPMHEFLNKFSQKHRKADDQFLIDSRKIFTNTIDVVRQTIGKKAFRPIAGINAAVFDSVMVGLARRLSKMPIKDYEKVKKTYDQLLSDPEYIRLVSQSTSDESNVSSRLKKTTDVFDGI
jgi:uncharacterized protein with ParB-like and HNH nuclease domain